MERMRIRDIRIGKRHRSHLGDVRPLATSMDRLGMLHPIIVDGFRRLVTGERRLAAAKLLGWQHVPVRVVRSMSDAAQAIRAQHDENVERKQYLPSEQVSIARALEPLERAEARKRQGARTDKHRGKFPRSSMGKSRDKLAAVVGTSGRTLAKARLVVDAADRDPKRFRQVLDEMDKSGKVDRAFRTVQRLEYQRQAESSCGALPKDVQVRHCSMKALFAELERTKRKPNLILTDPLYHKNSLPLYGELARAAAKVMRPGDKLAVMCGNLYLPEVLAMMKKHLPYRWTIAYLMTHGGRGHCRVWSRKVWSKFKQVLVFQKGVSRGWLSDVVQPVADSGPLRHPFEQSESGFTTLVKMLSEPGELVVDPFCGSGTTGAAAVLTGRRFIGGDHDAAAVRLTRARLARLKAIAS